MSKRNLTTDVDTEFAVITIDFSGQTTTWPVKSKGAATRKANSLSKDGAYDLVKIISPDLDPADAEDPQDEVTVVKNGGKKAKAAPKAKPERTCACGTITVRVPSDTKLTPVQREWAEYEGDVAVLNTGCESTTKSRFTPGHDARFHGLERLAARTEGSTVEYGPEPDAG